MTNDKDEHVVLPPLVSGKLHGHLMMKVDEVLWCRKCPGEVFVKSLWWGDKNSVIFWPTDVLKSSNSPKEKTIMFDIKTSLSLFEIYLRNCDQLELLVIKAETNDLLGKVYIRHLYQIATDLQYQSYFPIVNSFGNRIGDLHVGFFLWMKEQNSLLAKEFKEHQVKDSNSQFLSKEPAVKVTKKKGCNVCLRENKPKLDKVSPTKIDVPTTEVSMILPNTERSTYSDTVISEILIKGQQLRDAMVMSVLEDCDILKADKEISTLCLDSEKKPKDIPDTQETSTKDKEAIVDYLLGKEMSEEEEAKALETLRSTSPAHSLVELVEFHKEEVNEEESKSQLDSESVKDYQDQGWSERTADASKNLTPHLQVDTEHSQPLPSEYDRINCFRLTVKCLTLAPHGLKKVNPPLDKKSRFKGKMAIHPVTTYFIECHMDQNLSSQTQSWKVKPERFCSRRQIDNIVYFGQSSVYLVPTPFTLSGLNTVLKSMTWLVCWKHFSQRAPSLLGTINFESRTQVQSMETVWSLPVETVDGTFGSVDILLELGQNKKYFGNILLEKPTVKKQQNTGNVENVIQPPKVLEEEQCQSKHKKLKPLIIEETIQQRNTLTKKKQSHNEQRNSVYSVKEIPSGRSESLCTESIQYCVICRSEIRKVDQSENIPPFTSICAQCQIPSGSFKSSSSSHHSQLLSHEFILKIEKIRGFPLFENCGDNVKCYVDYKFLDVDMFGKVCTAMDTVTSKVMSCRQVVHFASDHLHRLNLPASRPLSSCLLSYKPGVTFQIWLRYFKPSPRDHMVAMAHLPISKLSHLELQFIYSHIEQPVIETIELPLILVPSSITAPYQHDKEFGSIKISISYRQLSASESLSIANTQKRTVPFKKICQQDLKWDSDVDEKENKDYKMFENLDSKKTVQTECSEKSVGTNSFDEQNLNFRRRRFWTGEFKMSKTDHVVVKDNKSKHTNKEDKVLKTFDVNNTEFSLYLNNFIVSDFKKQIEVPRLDLDNELSDSGIYSSTARDKIPQQTTDLSVKKYNEIFDFKNEIEPLVLETIHETDLTFYSLKSDLSSLTDIDENPSSDRVHLLESSENIEKDEGKSSDEDLIQKNEKNSKPNDENSPGYVTECVESESLPENNIPMSLAYDVNGLHSLNTHNVEKSVSLSKEEIFEGLIVNTECDHQNYGSNHLNHHDENAFVVESSKEKLFKARVEIEQALHLPMVTKLVNGELQRVAPSTLVSFKYGSLGNPKTLTTEVVKRNCSPVWCASWDVDLDIELLEHVDKRLVFSVLEEDMGGDFVFGYATADLNTILLGLPCLRSWLNICDLAFICKGQLKVNIIPLEDITQSKANLASNLAAAQLSKNMEVNRDIYIAQGVFSHFPSFIASQTEVRIAKMSSDDSSKVNGTVSETGASPSLFKNRIIEMEEFISGLKNKCDSFHKNDIEVKSHVNPLEENVHIKEHESIQSTKHDELNNRQEEDKKVRDKENEEKMESKEVQDLCASCCKGCHHCVCRHDNVQVQYLINPLLLQKIVSSISEMQVNPLHNDEPATNIENYNFQDDLITDKITSKVHKSTSCSQLEKLSEPNCNSILDKNITEFEEFLRGVKPSNVLEDTGTNLPSNAKTASEMNGDKRDSALDYFTVRETPEGGNPTVDVKIRSKLERKGTFIIDK